MKTSPSIPPLLRRALDVVQYDVLIGDLEEEYVEFVLPARGPLRARLWFWRHVLGSVCVGLPKVLWRRRGVAGPIDPHPTHRSTPRSEPMHAFFKDLKYGVKMLYKTPGVSLVAVITVALGVGITSHVFGVVYGSVIRGLPYEGAQRLSHISATRLSDGITVMRMPVHDFVDYREQQSVFDDLAAFHEGTVNLADDAGRPERVSGAFVSASLFGQVGVQPVLGRLFRDEEDYGRLVPTIVLGHDVWMSRYGGDPEILGKAVRANGRATTVIGVMPPGFRFPFFEDVWLPLDTDPALLQRGEGFGLSVVGRLKEGVTIDEANVQMASIAGRLAEQYPATNEGESAHVKPFVEEYMPSQIVSILYVMLGAVFGVLLIACANVANLLLARATMRTKEVAIRSALGASRGRVIRQLLVEALVLSLAGGVLGIAINVFATGLMNASLVDIEKPFWIQIRVDGPVLAFTIVVSMLAALASGTIPAIKASGAGLNDILKDESKGTSSFRLSRFSSTLVVGEIAVSCGLLLAAGFMVKSVVNVSAYDMGFDPTPVFTARVGLPETDYPDFASRVQFFEQFHERVRSLPGVQSAALSSSLPVNGASRNWFAVEGASYPTDQDYPLASHSVITPGFFTVLSVALASGRDFTAQDRQGSLPVAIVNATFVEKYLSGGPALGRRIRFGRSDSDGEWMTIVGTVPDIHIGGNVGGMGNLATPGEAIYWAYAQSGDRFMSVAAKTNGPPAALAQELRDLAASMDPNLPIYDARTMDEVIEANTWAFGLFGSLFMSFGLIALFMAAVGLYGVMAFSVSRRSQEMGIRMALGAHGRDIVNLVMRRGLLQLGIGIGAGLAMGAALGRPLQLVMFDVNPADPIIYVTIVATLASVGLLACFVPARRATRVDLVDALRPD